MLLRSSGFENSSWLPPVPRHQQREVAAVGAGDDARRLRQGDVRVIGCRQCRGRRRVVVGDGVVAEVGRHRVLDGHAATGETRDIVRDHVVEQVDVAPGSAGARARRHVRAVDVLESDAAAVAGPGQVAPDQVGVDADGAGAGADQVAVRGLQSRLAADVDSAAGLGAGLAEGLVEDDGVVLDQAVVREAQVADTGAAAGAEVAADPVLLDLVAVGARHQADAAADAVGVDATVLDHEVVVDADLIVERRRRRSARQPGPRGSGSGGRRGCRRRRTRHYRSAGCCRCSCSWRSR